MNRKEKISAQGAVMKCNGCMEAATLKEIHHADYEWDVAIAEVMAEHLQDFHCTCAKEE